jgi:tetratricopeptide (TPR) repeat protein
MAAIALAGLIWYVNIPGLAVASELITALSPSPQGLAGNLATFKDLTAHPAFAAQEVREQLVSFATNLASNTNESDAAVKQEITALSLSEIKKQVAAYPLDTREYMELAYAYEAAGDAKGAMAAILKAGELTPSKEDVWLAAGMLAWNTGDMKGARQYFTRAYELYPANQDLATYAAASAYLTGDPATGDKLLVGAYGTTTIDSPILAATFYQAKDWPRLVAVWQVRAAKPDATAETYFSLAAAYYVAGRSAQAIATIQEAVKKFPDPAVASSGAAAIKQIQAGVPIQ